MVHGCIAEAALRRRRESELLLWLVAIELKPTPGANGVSRRRLVRTVFEWGLFSRSYARQLLRQGDRSFWNLGARTAFLIGSRAVAASLGAGPDGRYRQLITVEVLRGGGARRRGAILGAAVRNDLPLSQAVIHGLTGVSTRSQRRYREAGCFKTIRQEADLTNLFDRHVSRSWLVGWANAHRSKGVYLSGTKLRKRLPNLHCAHGERIPPGQRAKEIFRGKQPLDNGEGCQSPRIWFASMKGWRNCRSVKLGTEAGEYYVDPEMGLNLAYVQIGPGGWEAVAMLAGR